jgi:hypothetical protein
MDDDGCRPRQIVFDVLKEGKYESMERDDAERGGQVARGDAIWREKGKDGIR